jgi:WD40 repeat protein/Tfp pilus assembly protein PilX
LANWGADTLTANAVEHVVQDLPYHRQHAQLSDLTASWKQQNCKNSLLLSRTEMKAWQAWLALVDDGRGVKPLPAEEQREYVRASAAKALRRRRITKALSAAVLVLILAGLIASVVMAILFLQQRDTAWKQRDVAIAERAEALAQSEEAVRQRNATETNLARARSATAVEKAAAGAGLLISNAQQRSDSYLALQYLSEAADVVATLQRPDLEVAVLGTLRQIGARNILVSTGFHDANRKSAGIVAVVSLAWLPNSPSQEGQDSTPRLAFGTSRGDVRMWDPNTGTTTTVLLSTTQRGKAAVRVVGLAYVQARGMLVSFGQDGTVWLQRITGDVSPASQPAAPTSFTICELSPDVALIREGDGYSVSVSHDGAVAGFMLTGSTACIVDLASSTDDDAPRSRILKLPFDLQYNWVLPSFAISPNGSRFVVGGYCDTFVVDTADGALVGRGSLGAPDACWDHYPAVSAWAADGAAVTMWYDGFFQDNSWNNGFKSTYDFRDEYWSRTFMTDTLSQVTAAAVAPVGFATGLDVCGNEDGGLVLATNRALSSLDTQQVGRIESMAWRSDGRLLATASSGGSVRIWDASASTLLGQYNVQPAQRAEVTSLSWSPYSPHLAVGTKDLSMLILRLDGQPAQVRSASIFEGMTVNVDWSTRRQLAAVDSKGLGLLLGTTGEDADSWQQHSSVDFGNSAISTTPGIEWSPNGKWLAALQWHQGACRDCSVALLSLIIQDGNTDFAVVPNSVKSTGARLTATAWMDDTHLAASSEAGKVYMWDMFLSEDTGRLLEENDFPVLTLAWSPATRQLATAGSDGRLRMHQFSADSPLLIVTSVNVNIASSGHQGPVTSLAWSESGVLASGGADHAVRVRRCDDDDDMAASKLVAELPTPVTALSWSRGGGEERLAVGLQLDAADFSRSQVWVITPLLSLAQARDRLEELLLFS